VSLSNLGEHAKHVHLHEGRAGQFGRFYVVYDGSGLGATASVLTEMSLCSRILRSQLAMAQSRLVIALHSPDALRETGLRMCFLEKIQDNTAFDAQQSVLRSPVCLGIIAKYGHCSRISVQDERNFSTAQMVIRYPTILITRARSGSRSRFRRRSARVHQTFSAAIKR